MFPRDLANCALRHAPSGRPTGVAETITGGATIAAISGVRPTQSARCTAIVDDAIVSLSDICPSPLVHVGIRYPIQRLVDRYGGAIAAFHTSGEVCHAPAAYADTE
jgi:hypothetical protein